MRLKQIRLAGFKSFVDSTKIPFPSDMTGIVGPNGCGKSNVIDAVRWVLGESSARQLRGEAMTDVIFNGSSRRAAVSKAMVELVFDNSSQRLGGEYAAYNEVAVRREVTRDGQNNYFLNGSRCRKKDITDIFLGTGLGPRSYAIIEQGMISRLIESKPHELRVFIEEAAGVSKYKERRRETENRLRHTEENLLRLRDIEAELEQQVSKLKTQASAARRYRQLRERHRELKALLVLQELRQIDYQLDNSHQYIEEQQHAQQALETQSTQLENQLTLLRNQQHQTLEQVNSQQQQDLQRRTLLAKLEQQLANAQQQAQQSELRQAQYQEQQGQLEQELAEYQLQLEQFSIELETAAEEQMIQQAGEEELTVQLEHAQEQLIQAQTTQREQLQQHAQHQQQQATLRSQLQQLAGLEQRHQQRHQQLNGQLDELARNALSELAPLKRQRFLCQQHLVLLQQSKQGLGSCLEQVLAQQTELRGKQAEQEKQQAALDAKLQGLEHLLSQQSQQAARPLSEALQVAAGWEAAVDSLLGAWLKAECVTSAAELAEQRLALQLSPAAEYADVPAAFAELQPIEAVLNGSSLQALVGQVWLCDTLAQASSLRTHLQAGQSLLTKQGAWLGAGWQRLEAMSGELSLLSIKAQAQQLRSQVADVERSLNGLSEQAERLQTQRQQLERRVKQQQASLELAQHSLSKAELAYQLAEQQSLQREQQVSRLQTELAELSQLQLQDAEQHALLEEQLYELEDRLEQLAPQRMLVEQQLEQAQAQTSNLQQQVRGAQLQAHQLQLKQQQLQSSLAHTQQQQQQAQQRQLSLKAQQDQLPAEHDEEQQQLLLEQIEQLNIDILEQEQSLEDLRASHRDADQQQQKLEQELKAIQSELQKLQEHNTSQRLQEQSLLTKRGVLLAQLAEQGENLKNVELSLPEPSLEQDYAAELQQVDAKLKRLGAVNLAAEEEFEQSNQRYQELCEQITDLDQAIEVLRSAIAKIDRQTRSKFKETFDKVDADLQQLFPKVFGGGSAWLELSSDDLLDTGVTIMARPPGKKNASISLLSGGEKALTALALVFAIFRLNPAPFCMLDEVDAPLDEVNVGRFADLVHSMSDSVQFIFISHNKVTMEKASQLAGVTMQEPGVSRLVAVDIEQALSMVE